MEIDIGCKSELSLACSKPTSAYRMTDMEVSVEGR